MTQWNAVQVGGSHDCEFYAHNPDRYPGHGYRLVNGIATEYYWFTGAKNARGQWVFQAEGWRWRLRRWWNARRGICVPHPYRFKQPPSPPDSATTGPR